MILGIHRGINADRHRQDEIDAGLQEVVRAAYACGVDQAFKRSDPEAHLTDEVIRSAFMVPWFLMEYVLHPERAANQPRHAAEVAKLDISPMREAADRVSALAREIRAERDTLRRGDRPDLDDLHMDGTPPPGLERSVVRHADGRPRPVFHVSMDQFDGFLPLSHFGSAIAVSRHADNLIGQAPFERMSVYGVWLDIRNPLVLEDSGSASSIWMVRQAHEKGVITTLEMSWIAGHAKPAELGFDPRIEAEGNSRTVMYDRFAEVLARKGYDGIRYENDIEGGGASWSILSSEQATIAWRRDFDVVDEDFVPVSEPSTVAVGL